MWLTEIIFPRLANILLLSKTSTVKLWNTLKKIKGQYVSTDCSHGLYSNVESQVNALEEQLQFNSSDKIMDNMTDSQLWLAGKMFTYLNSCSGLLKPWFSFYADLFHKQSLDVIILTLNRILKNENVPNKNLKDIAKTLFKRISSIFSLKYKEIQNISEGVGNFSWNDSAFSQGYLEQDETKVFFSFFFFSHHSPSSPLCHQTG